MKPNMMGVIGLAILIGVITIIYYSIIALNKIIRRKLKDIHDRKKNISSTNHIEGKNLLLKHKMIIKCPKCQQEYEVTEDDLGKEAECAICHTSFTLESPKLIKCPACEKTISKEAEACLNCGHPIKQNVEKFVYNPDRTEFNSRSIQSIKKSKAESLLNDDLAKYVGVKGWLAFFVFTQLILSPIFSLFTIVKEYEDLNKLIKDYPVLSALQICVHIEAITISIVVLIGIVGGVMLIRWSSKAILVTRIYLFAHIAAVIVNSVTVFLVGLHLELSVYIAKENIQYIISALFWAGIWLLYFHYSKRVKATFNQSLFSY